MAIVDKKRIDTFFSGYDEMKHIIKIECDYEDDQVYIIYNDDNRHKRVRRDDFKPFVWARASAAAELFNGDRQALKNALATNNIGVKGLRIADDNGVVPQRLQDGYRILFYSKSKKSFSDFLKFFEDGGVPIYPKTKDKNYGRRDYIVVAPNEQYMIATGRRLFKGYDDYDDLTRLEWDLETEGLNPEVHAISQIGIRTNKGYEKIITITGAGEEKYINEINAIREFFTIVREINPDVMTGHNTENFDWDFIEVRLKLAGSSLSEMTTGIFPRGIYKRKKQAVLKLGGEMEYYYPTIMWGFNITDSLHAVRRAQALDSNMKKADLKYVTKYSKLNKKNRVYVPGKIINSTWADTKNEYAFDNNTGEWFKITNKLLSKKDADGNYLYKKTDINLVNVKDNITYKIVTGKYIVERYLLDDLYETDKVELQYNQSNYLVCKTLPVSFEKVCTMGTAAIWKYIMLAWSYENDLAVPQLIESKRFTGGLSRLLSVGFVDRVVKLDYNSLYPSIILTWGIRSPIDIMNVMSALLEYILTEREYYKGLKAEFGEKVDDIKLKLKDKTLALDLIKELEKQLAINEQGKSRNDKLQLPFKIDANAFFGSYGSGSVFPWSDIDCAEETTCVGRMCLRLMIKRFSDLRYFPIVGDSFTSDTPIYVKYNFTNLLDIVPISSIIDSNAIRVDGLGREYDYSKKHLKILCRSGWCEPTYIYRHKTNKDIYRISDKGLCVDVTEDHSVYDINKKEMSPKEINKNTKLEYFNGTLDFHTIQQDDMTIQSYITDFNNGIMNAVPCHLLNATLENKKKFLDNIKLSLLNGCKNKTLLAGISYLKNSVYAKKN